MLFIKINRLFYFGHSGDDRWNQTICRNIILLYVFITLKYYYLKVAHRLFGVLGTTFSVSSLEDEMRPARWAGVEDSGGIVERLISDPKPDSASGRVLAKIYVPILFTMKTKKYRPRKVL